MTTDGIIRLVKQKIEDGADDADSLIDDVFYEVELDYRVEEKTPPADLRQSIERIVKAQVGGKSMANSTAGPLDSAGLNGVFERLEKNGIVARHHFSDNMRDALDDIWSEIDKKRGDRGYVFYHAQDTQRALASGVLALAFGSVEPADAKMLEIGRELAKELAAAGFVLEWDGTVDQRISIVGTKWKRRA